LKMKTIRRSRMLGVKEDSAISTELGKRHKCKNLDMNKTLCLD
jgi:hypothetical protein